MESVIGFAGMRKSSHKLLKQNLIGYRYGIQEECAASNRLVGMKDELHEIRQ